MIKNEFVFESGIAKVRDVTTNDIILIQPGKPGPDGLTPWASEDEARDWIYHQFQTYFEDITEPEKPDGLGEPTPPGSPLPPPLGEE